MAFCVVQEMPQGNQSIYEQVSMNAGVDGSPQSWPEGMLTHLAGPGENGGWFVVTEWKSREAFERFRDEKLRPAAQKAGVTPTTEPKFFQVYREYHAPELSQLSAQPRAA
jgi:hypothetical protein